MPCRVVVSREIRQILTYTNNVFELTLKPGTAAAEMTSSDADADVATKRTPGEPSTVGRALLLRGQMMLVDEWDLIIFLCTPVYTTSLFAHQHHRSRIRILRFFFFFKI